jgi:hypothetical protein
MPIDRFVLGNGSQYSGQVVYRDDHQAYDSANHKLYLIHGADKPQNVTVNMMADGKNERVGVYSFEKLEVDGTPGNGYGYVQIKTRFQVNQQFQHPNAQHCLLDFHVLQIIVDETYFNGAKSSPKSSSNKTLALPYTDPPYDGLAAEHSAPKEPFFMSLTRRATEFKSNVAELEMIDAMGFAAMVTFLHGIVHCPARAGMAADYEIRPLLMYEITFSKDSDDTPTIKSNVTQLNDPASPFRIGGAAASAFNDWKGKGRANQRYAVVT